MNGPVFSSPAVLGGLVYVGSTDGGLYALDSESGDVLWTVFAENRVWTSPAVFDGELYFGSHDGFVYAYEDKALDLIVARGVRRLRSQLFGLFSLKLLSGFVEVRNSGSEEHYEHNHHRRHLESLNVEAPRCLVR